MDKTKQIIELRLEIDYLKRKIESNIVGQFVEKDDICLNKTANKAIHFIKREGEVMPSNLAKYLEIKKSSATSLIDSLETEGLVYRKDDPSDRRKTLLGLTENGLERSKYMIDKMCSVASECMSDLSDEDIDEALNALKILVKFHTHMHSNTPLFLEKMAQEKCSDNS
ncbi:MarR family winged helix-turn-helix transcriptional regulator [Methanococcoides burtonii]|uniref:HTH transcriptional regulator, MarR/SlyA family n=1 Tax=Methanococcoides burtonii (strain DSM 6242 / NBRC 107633 / OCM 468 / ACE-M) TaxID=259564 RepID=Q12TU2_METBU|nr:MarR family transcriptional regulator [Methanococcoides burtonii]ABE53134.1 HTH transcriptional regulator, MarR/SlyA family [Methanococcoides burtonii DSM 6242]